MLWRLLPPAAAHVLGLRGLAPLVIPWVGVVSATAYVAVLFKRRCADRRFIFGGTLLFTTTSAVIVPFGWLGMNDAWVWLGLLNVAFGRRPWGFAVACLLCPWIDERFIIGFPLAWVVRHCESGQPLNLATTWRCLWIAPYMVARMVGVLFFRTADAVTQNYVASQLAQVPQLLTMAPFGWWFGLRAAWITVVLGCWCQDTRIRVPLIASAAITAFACLMLASDLSRSIAILTPVACLGCFVLAKSVPAQAPTWLLRVALANLLLPAAHVTFTKVALISPFPVEILRLLRT